MHRTSHQVDTLRSARYNTDYCFYSCGYPSMPTNIMHFVAPTLLHVLVLRYLIWKRTFSNEKLMTLSLIVCPSWRSPWRQFLFLSDYIWTWWVFYGLIFGLQKDKPSLLCCFLRKNLDLKDDPSYPTFLSMNRLNLKEFPMAHSCLSCTNHKQLAS